MLCEDNLTSNSLDLIARIVFRVGNMYYIRAARLQEDMPIIRRGLKARVKLQLFNVVGALAGPFAFLNAICAC